MAYYQSMVEVKPIFRTRSITMHRYDRSNPEELPEITKKHIISLANLSKQQNSDFLANLKKRSVERVRESASLRIKRIK